MPSGGRALFWGRWVSELSVFTLSRSESGVSVVPARVILGKELSCGCIGVGVGVVNDKSLSLSNNSVTRAIRWAG